MSIRKQTILLVCLLFFAYSYIHQKLGWNQNSRLDLLHALFVHKSFKIDAYHVNTGDKSVHNGHYYSDKAPGIVFLALPSFAISTVVLRIFDVPLDSPKGWILSSWLTTAGSVGLISALGGAAFFCLLCRILEPRYAWVSTLVVFLGSPPFPYATMLFSHAAVMSLICIALWFVADDLFSVSLFSDTDIRRCQEVMNAIQPSAFSLQHFFGGFCCGLAIASEYPAAIAAGGVLLLTCLSNWKNGLILALGAFPPLLLIPTYNWACFGSLLAFGYHHLALSQFQEMNKGLFGITFPPKAGAAWLILFSPERGLFFWTPFFIMMFFGLKPCCQTVRRLFCIACFVMLLQVAAISGYYMPSGGGALGPRHLAPMLPFAGIVAAFGLRQRPELGCLLGSYSLLLTGLSTLVTGMPPDWVSNPLLNYYVPRWLIGKFTTNLALQLGGPAFLSVIPMLAVLFLPFLWAARQCLKHAPLPIGHAAFVEEEIKR